MLRFTASGLWKTLICSFLFIFYSTPLWKAPGSYLLDDLLQPWIVGDVLLEVRQQYSKIESDVSSRVVESLRELHVVHFAVVIHVGAHHQIRDVLTMTMDIREMRYIQSQDTVTDLHSVHLLTFHSTLEFLWTNPTIAIRVEVLEWEPS